MSSKALTNELIRASAGTGKTYQLTNRYLRLLQMGTRPDDILATTFTRKAAGEILERVLLRLSQAATDDKHLAELRTAISQPSLTRRTCLNVLAETASRLHRLRIGTLDSFFAQLASSFALEIGLPTGWRIAESHEDAALRAQAIEAVLDNEDANSLLTLVHALTRGETTRSLEYEVRDKVNTLYSIYRESHRDAWHRVPRARELADHELAAAVDTVRNIPLPTHKSWEKSHTKDVEAAEAGDWVSFVKGGIAGKVLDGADSYYGKPIDDEVAAAYRPLIDHARAVQLNQLANQTEATFQLLDKFHAQYQRLKLQTRALRFEDITFQLAESVASIQPQRTAFRLDAHLHHLLLDEFQDTSIAQWTVIRPFAQQVTSGQSNTSFFCVGDVKQAIYGWRGGVAEIFDAVTSELADIEQRPLDTSWRSSPPIIHVVNEIFQHLQRHENLGDLSAAVVRWQQQFNTHQTAAPKQSLNGYVCLQAARPPRDDEAESPKEVTLRFVAEQVTEWQKRAPNFEIGVLVRRNDAVRRLIYELRELGIEASEEGGSTLDDSAAVRLILSLMQLADHPEDSVARFHLATSPLAVSLGLFDHDTEDRSAAVAFAGSQGDAAAGKLARQTRSRLSNEGYGRTVYGLARQLAGSCNQRELRRLEKLIGLAYQYDEASTSRPRDFVAFVNAAKVRDPIAADVRVMTVHQAKGLEFDIVVLADLEADLIGQRDDLVVGRPSPTAPVDRLCRRCNKDVRQMMPESWQKLFQDADDQDVAESLCVLYVAVTRAVHALHMIVAPSANNEKSLHKTFGGLLRAALTDGNPLQPEQVAYQFGDPQWFTHPGIDRDRTRSQVAAQAESLPPLEVHLAAAASPRWRGLRRESPSGLEGGTNPRLSKPSGDGGAERSFALGRGTLIHAWFEQIQWLDQGPPSDQQLLDAAADLTECSLSQAEMHRVLNEFRAMLDCPVTAGCLRKNFYADRMAELTATFGKLRLHVENERPIAVRDGDRLLVGNIDRLVTIFAGDQPVFADILDYKTDALDAGNERAVQEKVDHYRPQIEAYRGAVSRILRLSPQLVSARLLLLGIGRVVTLEAE